MNIATLPQALERIAELEEEKALLEGKLGLTSNENLVARLRRAWSLTDKEARILLLLANRSGLATNKELIMDALYRNANDEPEIKIVDVFVCKIRAKMGAAAIETVWGAGYRLAGPALQQVRDVLAADYFDIQRREKPDKAPVRRETLQAEVLALLAKEGPLTSKDILAKTPPHIRAGNITSSISAARRHGRAKIVDWQLHKDGYKRTIYAITDRGRGYVRERMGEL